MSATITIRPVAPTKAIGGSSPADALLRVFGTPPVTLDSRHIDTLRAMALAAGEKNDGVYNAIANAIELHEAIVVGVEW